MSVVPTASQAARIDLLYRSVERLLESSIANIETDNGTQQEQLQQLLQQWNLRVQTDLNEIIQEHRLIPALILLEQLVQQPTLSDGQPVPLLSNLSIDEPLRNERIKVKLVEKQRLEKINNQLSNTITDLKTSITSKRMKIEEQIQQINEMNQFLIQVNYKAYGNHR